MADSQISILDATGTPVLVDTQLPSGGQHQQTFTLGDGVNPGRTANVQPDGALEVMSNVASSSTLTSVPSSATSVTILAANPARRGAIFFNDSTSALFISYSVATTTATAFTVKIAAGGSWFMDVPVYVGVVTGMWTTANGACRVTDLTA